MHKNVEYRIKGHTIKSHAVSKETTILSIGSVKLVQHLNPDWISGTVYGNELDTIQAIFPALKVISTIGNQYTVSTER